MVAALASDPGPFPQPAERAGRSSAFCGAGIAVAISVRKALSGELVPDAVNVKGGAIHEVIRPSLPLVEKMSQIACALAGETPASIEVQVRGDISEHDVTILATSALKGAVIASGAEDVTYVNTPALAQAKGITATVNSDPESPMYRSYIALHAAFPSGESIVVKGTLMGIRMVEKIIAIDNFDLDLPPTDNLLFLRYADKPGVVGIVGQALGKVAVNIAGMHIARDHAGGKALMVITVDSPVDSPVVDSLKKEIGADLAESVTLVV